MAAYAATVTLDNSQVRALHLAGTRGFGIVRGVVDVTNYNTTLATITGITKYFRDTPTVLLGGISDNGFLVAWIPASKAIKAWYPTNTSDQTPTADITAAAAGEVVADVDVGAVPFVAIGRV